MNEVINEMIHSDKRDYLTNLGGAIDIGLYKLKQISPKKYEVFEAFCYFGLATTGFIIAYKQ